MHSRDGLHRLVGGCRWRMIRYPMTDPPLSGARFFYRDLLWLDLTSVQLSDLDLWIDLDLP